MNHRTKRWVFIWILVAFTLNNLYAQPVAADSPNGVRAGPSDPAEGEAFVDGFWRDIMQPLNIPGAVFVLVRDGQIVLAKGYGLSYLATGTPVDPGETLFAIGSVSKVVTAGAVLQLVERGKLRLDATVGSIDKRFSQIPDVTVEDLLCFRASLVTTSRMDAASNADEAEALLFDIRLGPPPARKFYTDMGAMVLKYLVEEVADCSFWELLNERILRPLSMTRSFAVVPEELLSQTVNCESGSLQFCLTFFLCQCFID